MRLAVKTSLSRLCTDVHGGGEVSRAVHLLGVGVRPGLSGSAPLPGTRGDPDRRERSCTRQTGCQLLAYVIFAG